MESTTIDKKFMKNKGFIPYYVFVCILMTLVSCSKHPALPEVYNNSNQLPTIYPDYTDVTIPSNIAPMNFMAENAEACIAQFSWGNHSQTFGNANKVQIPLKEWQEIMEETKGESIQITVYTQQNKEWTRHKPFHIHVAQEEVDPYISYRVISPSYTAYEMLSINQRHLGSFDESVVYNNMLINKGANGQCINCHSYQNYGTNNMQFHMRQTQGGTMIVSDGVPRKVNLKTSETLSAGVYPAWHPTQKLIAYSTNKTGQSFHTKELGKVEVFDSRSDLILYDIEKNQVSTISAEEDELEIYPWWSPDGNTLYYASAHFVYSYDIAEDAEVINRYKDIKYNIYRRKFDTTNHTFSEPELVYDAASNGQSATLPRISPCGRFLLFSMGDDGCFHIWHPEADLYIMDLTNGEVHPLEEANSNAAESYHSWSSNGRWILFSSRRDDSNYTRLYLSYVDEYGRARKAFAVPQEDPEYYYHYLRSYNVPEFMSEPVSISPQEFAAAAKKEAIQALYKN